MIPSPFQIKKKRSFIHKTGKLHHKKTSDLNSNTLKNSHDKNVISSPQKEDSVENVRSGSKSLKLCKKWLIGELKRVKKENQILRSHLDSPNGNICRLKEKLSLTRQKQSTLKQKYKALVHIHKSSLIELYNLALQESDSLRNDISLLNNVIHKLNIELNRYENGQVGLKVPSGSECKVSKLTNLKEVHFFSPLMKSYESLLTDKTSLIEQYRSEHAHLRKLNKDLEEKNHQLRKALCEFESVVTINVHRIESLSLNKELLAEQNEVLIHKVNLFNTTLNLLLSKYETLEIRNLQLTRKNNSLVRAARLYQLRSKFSPTFDPHVSYESPINRLKHDAPQAEIEKITNKGEHFRFKGSGNDLEQSQSQKVSRDAGQDDNTKSDTFFGLVQTNHGNANEDRNESQVISSKMKKKYGINENEGISDFDENQEEMKNRRGNKMDDLSVNSVEVERKIIELKREIVLLKERNALLSKINIDEHQKCINRSVHENIVEYFQSMFDELKRKYRDCQRVEKDNQMSTQEQTRTSNEKENTYYKKKGQNEEYEKQTEHVQSENQKRIETRQSQKQRYERDQKNVPDEIQRYVNTQQKTQEERIKLQTNMQQQSELKRNEIDEQQDPKQKRCKPLILKQSNQETHTKRFCSERLEKQLKDGQMEKRNVDKQLPDKSHHDRETSQEFKCKKQTTTHCETNKQQEKVQNELTEKLKRQRERNAETRREHTSWIHKDNAKQAERENSQQTEERQYTAGEEQQKELMKKLQKQQDKLKRKDNMERDEILGEEDVQPIGESIDRENILQKRKDHRRDLIMGKEQDRRDPEDERGGQSSGKSLYARTRL